MTLVALCLQAASASAPVAAPTDWRLYCAALKAAEASLRLHETDQAHYWLDEAPPEHRGFEWRLLEQLADRSAAAYTLHEGTITDLAVSPDGTLLATAGADGTARLVDARTGATLHVLKGHTASVWSPDFSADGKRLATASSDGTVRLWNVASGAEERVLLGDGKGVAALDFGPEGILAVSSWNRSSERGGVGHRERVGQRAGRAPRAPRAWRQADCRAGIQSGWRDARRWNMGQRRRAVAGR